MILGQVSPSALTDCYAVPAGRSAVVRVIAANRSTATTIRIALAENGAPDSLVQYVVYDLAIDANAALSSEPLALEGGDVVRASSASGAVSFIVDGIEQ